MLENAAKLRSTALTLTKAAFVASNPDPFLLVAPFDGRGAQVFETAAGGSSRPSGGYRVARIRKASGSNVFEHMVTVGRASNNDISIPAKGVSKFHAFFTMQGRAVHVTDAGSRNGTWVRGTQLRPREDRVALQSGDELRLGLGVHVMFVTPDALYEHLLSLPFLTT